MTPYGVLRIPELTLRVYHDISVPRTLWDKIRHRSRTEPVLFAVLPLVSCKLSRSVNAPDTLQITAREPTCYIATDEGTTYWTTP